MRLKKIITLLCLSYLYIFKCFSENRHVFTLDAPFPARSTPQSQLFYDQERWWGIFPHKEGNVLWERNINGWHQVDFKQKELSLVKGIADVSKTKHSIETIFADNLQLNYVQLVFDPKNGRYFVTKTEHIEAKEPIECALIEADDSGNVWASYLSDGKIWAIARDSKSGWSEPVLVSEPKNKVLFLNGITKLGNELGLLWSDASGVYFRMHKNHDSTHSWNKIEKVPAGDGDQTCNCLTMVTNQKGEIYVGTKKIVDLGQHYEKKRAQAFAYAKRSTEGQWINEPYLNLPKTGQMKRNPTFFMVSDPNYLLFIQYSEKNTPSYAGVSPFIPEPARNSVPFTRDENAYEVARSKQLLDQQTPMILLASNEKGQVFESYFPNLVCPKTETDFTIDVGRPKDNVDDIAIWVHPTEPEESLVIGTNKLRKAFDKKVGRETTGGLNMYSMSGQNLKFYEIGSQDNVDIRYGFPLGSKIVDIVSSTNQMDNTISVYGIDQKNKELIPLAARPIKTGIELYGYCMGYNKENDKYYGFVNSRQGDVEQYEFFATSEGKIDAKLVRHFKVGTQVEGCVSDDERGDFFLGEEKRGIWKMSQNPASQERCLVDSVGGLHIRQPDLEGLGIYHRKDGKGYLIASSQGSSEYVIYKRGPQNSYLKTFKIVSNGQIDGVELTDGLEVSNANLGVHFPHGVLIVHDSISSKTGNSNFKYVSWKEIAEIGTTKLKIDTKWNPREVLPKERQIYVSYDSAPPK